MKQKLLPLLTLCILGQNIQSETIRIGDLPEGAFGQIKTCPDLLRDVSPCVQSWIDPINANKEPHLVRNGVAFAGTQTVEQGGFVGYVLKCERNGVAYEGFFNYDFEKNELHYHNIDNVDEQIPLVEGQVYRDASGINLNDPGIIVENALQDETLDEGTRAFYEDGEKFFHILKSYILQLDLLTHTNLLRSMDDAHIQKTMTLVCQEVTARRSIYESIIHLREAMQSELSRADLSDKLDALLSEIDVLLGTAGGTEMHLKGRVDEIKLILTNFIGEAGNIIDLLNEKFEECCIKMDSLIQKVENGFTQLSQEITNAKNEIKVDTGEIIRQVGCPDNGGISTFSNPTSPPMCDKTLREIAADIHGIASDTNATTHAIQNDLTPKADEDDCTKDKSTREMIADELAQGIVNPAPDGIRYCSYPMKNMAYDARNQLVPSSFEEENGHCTQGQTVRQILLNELKSDPTNCSEQSLKRIALWLEEQLKPTEVKCKDGVEDGDGTAITPDTLRVFLEKQLIINPCDENELGAKVMIEKIMKQLLPRECPEESGDEGTVGCDSSSNEEGCGIKCKEEDESTKHKTVRELLLEKCGVVNPHRCPEIIDKVNDHLVTLEHCLANGEMSALEFAKEILKDKKCEFVQIQNPQHAMDIIKTIIDKTKCHFMNPNCDVLRAIAFVSDHVATTMVQTQDGCKHTNKIFEEMYHSWIKKSTLEYGRDLYNGLEDFYKFMMPIWISNVDKLGDAGSHASLHDHFNHLVITAEELQHPADVQNYHFFVTGMPPAAAIEKAGEIRAEAEKDFVHHFIKWYNCLADSDCDYNLTAPLQKLGCLKINGDRIMNHDVDYIFAVTAAVVESYKLKNDDAYPSLINVFNKVMDKMNISVLPTNVVAIRDELIKTAVAYSTDILEFFQEVGGHANLGGIFDTLGNSGSLIDYLSLLGGSNALYNEVLISRVYQDNTSRISSFGDSETSALIDIFKYGYAEPKNGSVNHDNTASYEKILHKHKMYHIFRDPHNDMIANHLNTFQLTDLIVDMMRNRSTWISDTDTMLGEAESSMRLMAIIIHELFEKYNVLLSAPGDNMIPLSKSMTRFFREFCCFIHNQLNVFKKNDAIYSNPNSGVMAELANMITQIIYSDYNGDFVHNNIGGHLHGVMSINAELGCIMKNCITRMVDEHEPFVIANNDLYEFAQVLFGYSFILFAPEGPGPQTPPSPPQLP